MAGSGFFIQVYQGLLEPKHRKTMGEALWLYLWLVDHQTDESGLVMHGKPVSAGQLSDVLGVPVKTIRKWLYRLRESYISWEAMTAGYRITILKPKRVFANQQGGTPKRAGVLPKGQGYPEKGTPRRVDLPPKGQGGTPKRARSYKEYNTDYNTAKEKRLASVVRDFVDKWNSTGTLPKIQKMSAPRITLLKTRLKEPLFAENWPDALDALARSPHHIGQNDRGWKADPEWFLRNDSNWLKVWEKAKAHREPRPDKRTEQVKQDIEQAAEDAVPPTPEFLDMMDRLGHKKSLDEAIGKDRPFLPVSREAGERALAEIRRVLDEEGLHPIYDPRRRAFQVDSLERAKAALESFVFNRTTDAAIKQLKEE